MLNAARPSFPTLTIPAPAYTIKVCNLTTVSGWPLHAAAYCEAGEIPALSRNCDPPRAVSQVAGPEAIAALVPVAGKRTSQNLVLPVPPCHVQGFLFNLLVRRLAMKFRTLSALFIPLFLAACASPTAQPTLPAPAVSTTQGAPTLAPTAAAFPLTITDGLQRPL